MYIHIIRIHVYMYTTLLPLQQRERYNLTTGTIKEGCSYKCIFTYLYNTQYKCNQCIILYVVYVYIIISDS